MDKWLAQASIKKNQALKPDSLNPDQGVSSIQLKYILKVYQISECSHVAIDNNTYCHLQVK